MIGYFGKGKTRSAKSQEDEKYLLRNQDAFGNKVKTQMMKNVGKTDFC